MGILPVQSIDVVLVVQRFRKGFSCFSFFSCVLWSSRKNILSSPGICWPQAEYDYSACRPFSLSSLPPLLSFLSVTSSLSSLSSLLPPQSVSPPLSSLILLPVVAKIVVVWATGSAPSISCLPLPATDTIRRSFALAPSLVSHFWHKTNTDFRMSTGGLFLELESDQRPSSDGMKSFQLLQKSGQSVLCIKWCELLKYSTTQGLEVHVSQPCNRWQNC